MKIRNLVFLSFVIVSISYSQSGAQLNEYESILNQFSKTIPVEKASIPETGMIIKKDSIIFRFDSGTIYKLSKVEGREIGFYFKGKGNFTFVPPDQIERDHLKRFVEKEKLNDTFNEILFLFADSSYLQNYSHLNFEKADENYTVTSRIKYCLSYLFFDDYDYFDTDFMQAFLDGKNNSLTYAHIELDDLGALFLRINPYDFEEVTLSKKISTVFLSTRSTDLINSFHLNDPFSKSDARKQKLHPVNIPLYDIKFKIEDNLDVSGICNISFNKNNPSTKWIRLILYYDLEVDSIFINNKKTLKFFRGNENPELWVKLPEELDPNINSLKIFYHGDLLERDVFGWISIKSSNNWYPNQKEKLRSLFKLNFTYPTDFKLISIGEQTSINEYEDSTNATWDCNLPTYGASFNFGRFEKYEFSKENSPKVNVWISPSGHSKMSHQLAPLGILSGADMEEKIGTDVLGSIQFYQTLLGKIDLNEFNVTEIPYSHGQAFPGLVHLPWYNYQGVEFDGAGELFRAHEVAHQWWGMTVDFEDYHDQWISEGFSEFYALYFVQAGLGNDAFFKILEDWKERIIENRKYLFGEGQKAGPIWLGYRTNSSETSGDYSVIVYEKGAWVLHMLRNLLLDLKTMKDDNFNKMMKEFFDKYKGRRATTNDFKLIVDKYLGEDSDWFFNQYVYGTDIPLYRFSYSTEKLDNGKFQTTCKVIQENVPENFKMYVPFKVELSNNRFAYLRMSVTGKETIVKLPPLDEEPEDIEFNVLNSVLCEID